MTTLLIIAISLVAYGIGVAVVFRVVPALWVLAVHAARRTPGVGRG
ncbi:hypothetical protein [Streptomyces sp. NPDC054784]